MFIPYFLCIFLYILLVLSGANLVAMNQRNTQSNETTQILEIWQNVKDKIRIRIPKSIQGFNAPSGTFQDYAFDINKTDPYTGQTFAYLISQKYIHNLPYFMARHVDNNNNVSYADANELNKVIFNSQHDIGNEDALELELHASPTTHLPLKQLDYYRLAVNQTIFRYLFSYVDLKDKKENEYIHVTSIFLRNILWANQTEDSRLQYNALKNLINIYETNGLLYDQDEAERLKQILIDKQMQWE